MLTLIKRIYNSIALLPSLIAMCFGMIALLLVFIHIPTENTILKYITIEDKVTIQFVLTFVITGIFTLTVFSYTMVMSVLNRSISNYSPRLIPLLLAQKHHQVILGFTTGTIVYSLILALFVTNKGNRDFPTLGAFFSIFFAIVCTILFIYFLHTVSQSIHINYILSKSFQNTKDNISKMLAISENLKVEEIPTENKQFLSLEKCGYLQKVRIEKLGKIAAKNKIHILLKRKMGEFFLENEPILEISEKINKKTEKQILRCINVDRTEAMDVMEIGFKHLVEVAIKASSPAINDPGTSIEAIDYLTQLFVLRSQLDLFNCYQPKGGFNFYFTPVNFEALLIYCFTEMKRYMNDDPILVKKLKQSLEIISVNKARFEVCTYEALQI